MKHNYKYGNLANDITLAQPVPTNTAAGDVVKIGAVGRGYAITPRATTVSIAAGEAAPGLKDTEASVRLLPCQVVIEVPGTGFAIGAAVYAAQDGTTGVVTYSTASAGYFVGIVTAQNTTTIDVFLGASTPELNPSA